MRTGIILAGGKSQRMGQDKGLMLWKGKPLVSYIIEAVAPLVEEIIIITANKAYQQFGWAIYEDMLPDAGPLGGLYTGLYHSSYEENLVLSCDVPLVSTALLHKLIDNCPKKASILRDGEQIHPLIACYAKSLLPIIEARLKEKQYSMKGLLNAIDVEELILTVEEAKALANINTKWEFERWLGT